MKPELPLKRLLARSEPDRATLDRVWSGVKRREQRRHRAPVIAALAMAAALVLTFALVLVHRSKAVAPAPFASRTLVTGTVQVRPGVELIAGPGAVVWASVREGRVELDAEQGEVRVKVAPGERCLVTSRRLAFEVAAAQVRFEAGGEADALLVEEGEVLLREAGAPSRAVHAGQTVSSGPSWRALAKKGDLLGAWNTLGHDGVAREAAASGSLEERTLLADIAAAGRDWALAVTVLEGVVAAPGASGPERAIAAYDLGLRLLENGEPSRAAKAFEQSLSLELPAALRRDARARAAEASMRAGDTAGARRWLDASER